MLSLKPAGLNEAPIGVTQIGSYEPSQNNGVALSLSWVVKSIDLPQCREIVSQTEMRDGAVGLLDGLKARRDFLWTPDEPLFGVRVHRSDAVDLSDVRKQSVTFDVEDDPMHSCR